MEVSGKDHAPTACTSKLFQPLILEEHKHKWEENTKTCPKGTLRDGMGLVYQSLDLENVWALAKTKTAFELHKIGEFFTI